MDLALKELLTKEELARSKEPLSKSKIKREFLQTFLRNHCQPVLTLNELSVSPVELKVWRTEDELFESLYKHYEDLSNEELAASIRTAASAPDGDLKVKLSILAALDPEYNVNVAREKAKRAKDGIDPDGLSTLSFTDGPDGPSVGVRDPIAAVASKVIEGVELDKVMPTEPKVNPFTQPKPLEEDDPIKVLVQDSLESGRGVDFVKYFRPRED